MDADRNYGTLYIKLRKETGLAPATGAVVQAARGGVIIATAYTDANGEAMMTLPSTDYHKSQIPNPPSLPYTVYDVRASLAGYIPVLFKGVQIFPGIAPVQRYDMIRTTDKPKKRMDVIIIPPHKLSTGVPVTAQNNNAPKETIIYAMPPEVVIPENITVHLGPPSSNAENVTIPFITYIKNVASSELYPTWPEAALRANIIAEVSMALNRIHTEWYKSQGYDFDITSVPEYDQTYVHGRTTFDTTDRIVNELFNQYIVTPGHVEPIFTSYCDGYITECKGLSQWGTVELANQYYTPLDILRYYYGDDVYLKTAPVQKAVPDSFPGDLKLGDESEDVAVAQYRLNRAAINYPNIPFIENADGKFGESTLNAVKQFQSTFGITPTGVIDETTWYRILYIFNAVKKLAELESEGRHVYNEGYPGYVLNIGDRDLDVLRMEFYLERLSNYLGENIIPPITVNGIYDAELRNAVYAFQNYYGITPSGVIDEETWNAIVTAFYDIPKELTPETPPYPGTPVRYGDSGTVVKFIQHALNIIGEEITDIPRLDEDSTYGDLTRNAVKAFQKYYGLAVDGIVGPLTWARLNSEYSGISGEESVG